MRSKPFQKSLISSFGGKARDSRVGQPPNEKKPRGLSTASGRGRDPGVNGFNVREPGWLVKPIFKAHTDDKRL